MANEEIVNILQEIRMKLEQHDKNFEGINKNFEAINKKLQEHDVKLDNLASIVGLTAENQIRQKVSSEFGESFANRFELKSVYHIVKWFFESSKRYTRLSTTKHSKEWSELQTWINKLVQEMKAQKAVDEFWARLAQIVELPDIKKHKDIIDKIREKFKGNKFLREITKSLKKYDKLQSDAERDRFLVDQNGFGLVVFSCLCYNNPYFLQSLSIEFDCFGSFEIQKDRVILKVGEIKATANAYLLEKGFIQLIIRLKILEQAAKILYPDKETVLQGLMFLGGKLDMTYNLPQQTIDKELAKFRLSTAIEFHVFDGYL